MSHRTPILLACALLLVGCSGGGDDSGSSAPPAGQPGTPAPPPVPSVSALFVLGDSLSDVGNAAGAADYLLGKLVSPATVGLCNPADVLTVPRDCEDLFFRKTRVSDGPVAVEHLAEHLGLAELTPSFHVVPSRPSKGTNYAVASAKARGSGAEDLTHQVDVLLLDHVPLPADALYVVFIGGNDAIDALQAAADEAQGPQASAQIVTSTVAAIVTNVERLLDFGARRIVVANVPDLASLPATKARASSASDPAALLAAASKISEDFDREVRAFLARDAANPRWSAPTAPVLALFDLRAAWQAAQQTTTAAGGDASNACFDSTAYRQSSTAQRLFDAGCAPEQGGKPRFARFMFWDGIHPTGAAHAALGTALSADVDAALAGS